MIMIRDFNDLNHLFITICLKRVTQQTIIKKLDELTIKRHFFLKKGPPRYIMIILIGKLDTDHG